jgi:hypothetical protein
MEYEVVARQAMRSFIPIYLTCDVGENLRRATSLDRTNRGTTKLTNIKTLKFLRTTCDLFRLQDYPSLTIDVIRIFPLATAMKILAYLQPHYQGCLHIS